MKSILFSTEMVRAILEGRKTVTRRVVKPKPAGDGSKPEELFITRPGYWNSFGDDNVYRQPYLTGDILYVRETWSPVYVTPKRYIYKADVDAGRGEGVGLPLRWHPSIHMPKEAARIFLQVTGVRVERLQEIECISTEGVTLVPMDKKKDPRHYFIKLWDSTIKPADLPLYGWEADPWVWVIEFERISKEEMLAAGKGGKDHA